MGEGKKRVEKIHIEEHSTKGKKRRRLIIAVETSYDGQGRVSEEATVKLYIKGEKEGIIDGVGNIPGRGNGMQKVSSLVFFDRIACEILTPRPGIEPTPSAVRA